MCRRGCNNPAMTARPIELLATCTFGLEAVVVRELADLGYEGKPIGTGRVMFSGDERAICEANLWLRAADRVLVRVGSFDVGGGDAGFDDLFEGVKSLAWERWIGREAGIPVSGRCVRSQLMSEPAVQRATKKAIVERLGAAYGKGGLHALLPETDAPVHVEVAIVNNVASLTIDTSGMGLHKRGYRDAIPGDAALRETMAAGLVLLSVWRPGRPLVDPFCGSGTIPIEAAMIGRSIAPGLNRSFDAERWVDSDGRALIDPALWEEVRAEARAAIVPDRLDPVIHASDISEGALRMARGNARAAGHGIEHDIQFIQRDVADLSSTKEYGVVVTNPPYGVRLGDEKEIEALYRTLPAIFRRLPTWSFHILSGRLDLEWLFGQHATRRRKLYNSKIECGYFSFLGPKPPSERRATEEGESDQGASVEATAEVSAVEAAHLDETDDAAEPAHEGAMQGEPVAAPAIRPAASAPTAPVAPRPVPAPVFGGLSELELREAEDFGRCLGNNLRHLRKYPSRGIFCYRVYERDVPDVPLILDRYESEGGEVWFHAAEYERPHDRSGAQQADWFDLMRRTIADVGGVPRDRVVMKEKHRQRGLTQHEKVGDQKRTMIVREGSGSPALRAGNQAEPGSESRGTQKEPGSENRGTQSLRFEVNLSDYIDTGLFLDHRLTREMVRKQSGGKRVLNLFCYTGSFTVYAASGGAATTTSVDLSNTYGEWALRNLGLNNLYSTRHTFLKSDVMEFLREHARPDGGAYDLVIVDPPTFSNSKGTEEDWEVSGAHVEMFGLLGPLMSAGGVAYFSTNFRRFKMDEAGVAEAGFSVREISRRTVPPEYRNKRIHRCWRLVMVGREQAMVEVQKRVGAAEGESDGAVEGVE
jgi:23S rRNA (guanine2445-N2)-methyltransferase / 23S rRNA (guanine2069-N7)-methyltransferase